MRHLKLGEEFKTEADAFILALSFAWDFDLPT